VVFPTLKGAKVMSMTRGAGGFNHALSATSRLGKWSHCIYTCSRFSGIGRDKGQGLASDVQLQESQCGGASANSKALEGAIMILVEWWTGFALGVTQIDEHQLQHIQQSDRAFADFFQEKEGEQ